MAGNGGRGPESSSTPAGGPATGETAATGETETTGETAAGETETTGETAAGETAPRQRRAGPRHAKRTFIRRRIAVGVIALAVLVGVGLVADTLATSGPSARRAALGSKVDPSGSTVPATTTTTLPPPTFEPRGGRRLFPSHRLVAFYGAPASPTLGVLGDAPPAQMWNRLTTAAAPFDTDGKTLIPSYELIVYTAQAAPGPGGTYTARLPDAQIDSYLKVVRAHHGMLILDIQPGLSRFLPDAKTLAPWLDKPDVALALDPEWEIGQGELPGQVIGHTTAAEINQVSAWLERLSISHGLPQKLLLVHQFLRSMVEQKWRVQPHRDLAIAFNMDGFGGTMAKVSVYRMLARNHHWPLGYKLFYQRDTPLQTPAQVMALKPPPSIIEYE